MLLSKHFVFIHVQKTGGTTVRTILGKHAPKDWELTELDGHPSYADIPQTHAGLPKLAFIRNPYSWYVSWFHFQRDVGQKDFFYKISDGGKLGFADSMRRMFKDRPALEFGAGPFLQYLWECLGPGLENVKVGRMENMRSDLARLLGECCELPPAMAKAIAELPVLNASAHDHYSKYYDDELREMIYERDKLIFDHYGYTFEPAPAAD